MSDQVIFDFMASGESSEEPTGSGAGEAVGLCEERVPVSRDVKQRRRAAALHTSGAVVRASARGWREV